MTTILINSDKVILIPTKMFYITKIGSLLLKMYDLCLRT
jgi:hypothetical protein